MRRTRLPTDGETGFALAEALIGLLIIAVTLGTAFGAIASMSHDRRTLLDERRAALLAQSLLARVGTDIALAPGSIGGVSDGMRWHIDIDPWRSAGPAIAGTAPRLLRIAVAIPRAPGQAGFALQSLRLAP